VGLYARKTDVVGRPMAVCYDGQVPEKEDCSLRCSIGSRDYRDDMERWYLEWL